MPDEPPPEPPQLVPGGFGGVGVEEDSCGFGADEPGGVELGAPELGVVGRGCGGGVAGRGGAAAGAGAGFGGIGAAAGRGEAVGVVAGRGMLGADDGVIVDVVSGAAFRAVFLAAFLRAGLALRADFLAPALRPALAAPRLPAFFALRPPRAAAARRLAAVDFAGRPAFLRRPRFDFDFDPVRAIKPPVVSVQSLHRSSLTR